MTVERTKGGDALTDLVMTVFRLNGLLLEAAERMTAPSGLTAARWQVLGPIMADAKTVSVVAREMGLARQSVQRLANVLINEGLIEYLDNPSDRRAKFLSLTKRGHAALRRVGMRQHVWANTTSKGVDVRRLEDCAAILKSLGDSVAQQGKQP